MQSMQLIAQDNVYSAELRIKRSFCHLTEQETEDLFLYKQTVLKWRFIFWIMKKNPELI